LELGKLYERVAEVENDRTIEAEQLSWSTMEIANALVDLMCYLFRASLSNHIRSRMSWRCSVWSWNAYVRRCMFMSLTLSLSGIFTT
jgi:hypothetical protein